jgi:hypothetical protein
MTCKWIVREGSGFLFWAYTPCKSGFNPLSRINKVEQIKPCYDGRQCPICGKPIECNIELVAESEVEDGNDD